MSIRKVAVIISTIVGALLALSHLIGRRERVDWRDAERPGRIVDVDGVGVHYVERGSGPAIVLVHGFGGHTFSFRHLIPDLAKDHRVVALDLKGFGYSERPKKSDYSLGAQARLVLRLMDTLGVESATLVGHSMGGEVVMRVAARAPERVERLVLAASVSGERIPLLPPLPIIRPFLPLIGRVIGDYILRRSFYDRSELTPEMRREYRAPTAIRGFYDAVWQMMQHLRRDRSVDFGRIRQPVLILWASHERIVPRWMLHRLRKRLPQAGVVTIDRAGHLLLEERPAECLAAIRRFLGGRAGAIAADVPAPSDAVDIAQPAS